MFESPSCTKSPSSRRSSGKYSSGSPEATEEDSHDGIVKALQGQYLVNDELGVKLHHDSPLRLQFTRALWWVCYAVILV